MKQNNDIQAALDALNEIIDDLKCSSITGELTQNQKSEIETIRAALTAQQSDVNQVLTILRKVLDFLPDKKAVAIALDYECEYREFHRHDDELVQNCVQRIHDLHDYVEQAIARAEKEGS